MRTGRYVVEFGDVWHKEFENDRELSMLTQHICGPSDALAIAYCGESGTLYKRGSYRSVKTWHDKTVGKYRAAGCDGLAALVILASFPANEDGVALLNKSLINSTVVLRMIECGELPGIPLCDEGPTIS